MRPRHGFKKEKVSRICFTGSAAAAVSNSLFASADGAGTTLEQGMVVLFPKGGSLHTGVRAFNALWRCHRPWLLFAECIGPTPAVPAAHASLYSLPQSSLISCL